MIVAAAVLAWSPAWTDDEPVRFHDAVKLYEAKKYPEAFEIFEVLAREWDSRAQVLLGIAWLRIAAGETCLSPTNRARAAEQLRMYESALSGADLIRADALAGELLAERRRKHGEHVSSAYDRLLQAEPEADDIKESCALDTGLTECRVARGDVEGRGDLCLPPEHHWQGAAENRDLAADTA